MRGRDPVRRFYIVVSPSWDDGSLDWRADNGGEAYDSFDDAKEAALDAISGCPSPHYVYEVQPVYACHYGQLREQSIARPRRGKS